MQEIIITTLLKFNDILDAFQQVFKIHNYNCNQQREILEKCLEKEYNSSCIYISVNSNNQFFPNYKDLQEIELKLDKEKQHQDNNLQELIETNVQQEVYEVKKSLDQLLLHQSEKLNDFKSYVSDIYLTKTDIRQFKSNSEERINKLQDQIQSFQTKYALKLYTEQHIIDIKQAITQIQSANNLIKQDSQTLHKLNRDNRQMIKQQNEQTAQKIDNLEKQQYKIYEFEKEVENMKTLIQEQKSGIVQKEGNQKGSYFFFDIFQNKICICMQKIKYYNLIGKKYFYIYIDKNDIVQNKVKSLSQLFQELEVNNSKVVKFEIHTAFKKVDEELIYFKNRQQSFQDQLQLIKEQFSKYEIAETQFQCGVNEQFDLISAELVKNKQIIKSQHKNIALLQQSQIFNQIKKGKKLNLI